MNMMKEQTPLDFTYSFKLRLRVFKKWPKLTYLSGTQSRHIKVIPTGNTLQPLNQSDKSSPKIFWVLLVASVVHLLLSHKQVMYLERWFKSFQMVQFNDQIGQENFTRIKCPPFRSKPPGYILIEKAKKQSLG